MIGPTFQITDLAGTAKTGPARQFHLVSILFQDFKNGFVQGNVKDLAGAGDLDLEANADVEFGSPDLFIARLGLERAGEMLEMNRSLRPMGRGLFNRLHEARRAAAVKMCAGLGFLQELLEIQTIFRVAAVVVIYQLAL